MKRLFMAIIVFLAMASVAWSAPFLVCTPDPDATNYLIKINGADPIELPAPLHWDLQPLADRTYNLEVAAKNIWGSSAFVPFDFDKKLPSGPLGIGLSAE